MEFFLSFLAPIFQTGSLLTDKIVLSLKSVHFKNYIVISFPLTFILTLCIFLIFRPPFSFALLMATWPLIFISVGISIGTNLLLYKGLGKDKLSEIETIELFHNIPIIILSSILFADERNPFIIIAAVLGSLAVIWSHWEHHHLKIAKQTWPFLIWMITVGPINSILIKILLMDWNPLSFSLIRAALMALVFDLIFFRSFKKVSGKGWLLLLLTNILTSIAGVLYFLSYKSGGIVFTVLLVSLQPLLVYIGSLFLLKEKFHWKKALAFAVILACILPSQILK